GAAGLLGAGGRLVYFGTQIIDFDPLWRELLSRGALTLALVGFFQFVFFASEEITSTSGRLQRFTGLRVKYSLVRVVNLTVKGVVIVLAAVTIPQIWNLSIAGLIATDLHGSGREHGFLSEQVLSLRIVAADGSVASVGRGDPLFHAAFGALGCCGVVCEVELELVPAFNLEKTTAMVDRAASEAELAELLRANDHVSFYYVGGADESESVRVHQWNHTDAPVSEGWEKLKTRAELSDFAISAFMPWAAELIADIDEDSWLSNVLAPDHRLIMPGSQGFGRKLFYRHDEIEYGVPLAVWRECLTKVMEFLRCEDYFSIVEVRFTPNRSQALLGPGVGRETAYIELATPLSQERDRVYAKVEEIFWAFGGQPHLGKKTNVTGQRMLEIYGERYAEFQALRARQDPGGKFLNPFTQRVFG
ncbi:MAG: hypothetical protein HC927_06690, partial [Deltaproteobacteria bacterium]|nr:hypothetical protein [Deltaproteobacteria bacterium]